jgi:nicotinamidase-related amidase
LIGITPYKLSSVAAGVSVVMILALCFGYTMLLQATGPSSAVGRSFRLPLRTEVQAFKGSSVWQKAHFEQDFSNQETAIVICDMWDRHWCTDATQRVGQIAHKIEPVLQAARSAGILVIHAPSETMDFYKDYPQRRLMLAMPRATPPPGLGLTSPALPIDDFDRGCQTPGDTEHKAWTRENPILSIESNDVISDNGEEIYALFHQRGIKNLFIMGVHTNMCILNRTFAIKQMTNWGISCVLVRDLTDSMYNPKSRPYVSHAEGTELVIGYIEKHWCPTTLSADFVKALKQ